MPSNHFSIPPDFHLNCFNCALPFLDQSQYTFLVVEFIEKTYIDFFGGFSKFLDPGRMDKTQSSDLKKLH